MIISIQEEVGSFAENKDIARDLRERIILPALTNGEQIVMDFEGVEGATQSFIHALISQPIRQFGSEIFDVIEFKNCNSSIKKIIMIVAEYMQASE